MTAPVLEVTDLHARLGGSHVLQGVTFQVAASGVTALLGRNGVGKTTTLRAVLGLVSRRGEVRLRGERVDGEPTHRIVRRGVGYVPEEREVFAGLTVAENLRLAERGGPLRHELVRDLFPDLVARAGQRAGTLSGGQQQMLALARALLNDNVVLLVDEPTKGLAPRVVSEVASALAAHSVYVSTSPSDGVSASLLEAMACGVFPVVVDNPSNREWVEHGINGLLHSGDVGGLATHLARALSDHDLRRGARTGNLALVERRGDLRRNSATIAEALLALC